ncbi:MAG TPA: hypothetical protein VLA88_02280 [Candidatus Saccharimonadales bacterium]|nr:hypothetical protein [Candidatus Saccharimonadales bacterium]
MHTLSIKKSSLMVGDTELTDDEIAFALRVSTLLQARLSDVFLSYVRALAITFKLAGPQETRLGLDFELFIPKIGGALTLEFATLLTDEPLMDELAAVTSLTYIEESLRLYARETGKYQAELYEVAGAVRK